jgi:hypothetical protein
MPPAISRVTSFDAADDAVPGGRQALAGDARYLSGVGIAVLIVCVFMPQVDYFIVNVALPTIDRSLRASSGALELVVAGYGTAYAALLVVGGRLGDMVGRRRALSIGLAGFTVASLGCGVAPSVWFLLGARLVQGASAAMIVPQVLTAPGCAERKACTAPPPDSPSPSASSPADCSSPSTSLGPRGDRSSGSTSPSASPRSAPPNGSYPRRARSILSPSTHLGPCCSRPRWSLSWCPSPKANQTGGRRGAGSSSGAPPSSPAYDPR